MMASSVAFSVMAALVKGLSAAIPTAEIVAFRCLLPLPLLIVWVRGRGLPLVATNRPVIVWRSVCGLVAMGLYFYALGRIPFVDVMLLGKAQPVFVTLLAPFVIGERATGTVISCLLLSVAGAALVLHPTLQVGNLVGLAVIAAAFASALAHMAVRRLSATDHPVVIVMNFTAFVAVAAALATIPVAVVPTLFQALGLAGVAVFATAGQVLMTSAYAADEAPAVSAAKYSSVVFGLLFGWLFWAELPNAWGWAGGLFVLVGGVLLVWSRRSTAARTYGQEVA